ncbi:MAG TPA: hypothetical protein VF074_15085 [Pyrinomonadaceae bacterium]
MPCISFGCRAARTIFPLDLEVGNKIVGAIKPTSLRFEKRTTHSSADFRAFGAAFFAVTSRVTHVTGLTAWSNLHLPLLDAALPSSQSAFLLMERAFKNAA